MPRATPTSFRGRIGASAGTGDFGARPTSTSVRGDMPTGIHRRVARGELWIWAALAGFAALATILVRAAIADDAFIYLRFAQNLARGDGWAFNPGETIAGTTSPLFTALLALLHVVEVQGPASLLVLFAAGLAAIAIVTFSALRAGGPVLAIATALVAITWPPLLRAVGLETSLLLATAALAALAYERGRLEWAGAFSGLCALSRPEGIAMLAALVLVTVLRRDRRPGALIWPFLAVITPWLLFAWATFGSAIPHSVRVKSIQGSIDWWTQEGTWIATFARQIPGTPWIYVLLALGIRRALRDARSGRSFALVISLFGASQVLGYAVLEAPPGYLWYYAPGNFAVVVLAACGIRELDLTAGKAWRRWRAPGEGGDAMSAWTGARLAVLTCVAVALYASVASGALRATASRPFRLAPEYRRAALWLAANGSPGDWVAANETGYIGYYSGLRVRDMLGLLHAESPEPLRRREWDWWFTAFPRPRFVVIHAGGWIGEPMTKRFAWPEASLREFESTYERRHVEGMVAIFERRR